MAKTAKERFEKELGTWLDENPSLVRKVCSEVSSRANFFRRFQFRWLSLPYFLVVTLLTASGPAIAYQTSGNLDEQNAVALFVLIFIALAVTYLIDRWSRAQLARVSGPLQEVWVRVGDLLNTIKSTATAAHQKDGSIEASLAIAASIAAEIAKVKSGETAASLVQYRGTGFSRMQVTHRNRGSSRPVSRRIKELNTLLGHHACQRAVAPRVVPDIRKFGPLGRKSPTQTTHSYRSILIQPVVSSRTGLLKGFISIDCTLPHAFHSHRADDLVALLEPIKAHIEDMI